MLRVLILFSTRSYKIRGESMIRKTQTKMVNKSNVPYLFIFPAFVLILAVIIYPLLYSFYISLNNVQGKATIFVGLKNYIDILGSDYFWQSTGRTLYFTVVSVGLELVLGILVAVLLNENFFGRGFVRSLVILPWALPTVVNGVLWAWIFDSNYGALNGLLTQLHVIDAYKSWLGTPFSAMNSVIFADVWKNFPMMALILLAALQTINQGYYEAAKIDGASVFQRFFNITLPMLKPAILVALVIRTMEAFKVFDIIYTMTKGGPANGTQVISYYAYVTSFQYVKFGYGAALSYLVAIVILFLALIYIKFLYTDEY
jgi:ABC-type sugar transport system permease subunit